MMLQGGVNARGCCVTGYKRGVLISRTTCNQGYKVAFGWLPLAFPVPFGLWRDAPPDVALQSCVKEGGGLATVLLCSVLVTQED